MAGKRKDSRSSPKALTPNQVVALKLEEARTAKRWTQMETVRQLRKCGLRWSRAAYAMAVGSPKTGRTARFDADQLVAFGRVFGVPVWKFFIPPVTGRAVKVALPNEQPSTALNEDAMFHVARGRIVEEPRSEEERNLREEEEARTLDRLIEVLRKHHLLPKPEPPLEFPPEVQADLGKAFARVLKKHGIALKDPEWPCPSPYQIQAIQLALKSGKEK